MTEAEDDRWMRVASGDLDPNSEEWRQQLAGDPALARRWSELQRLQTQLDAAGREERGAVLRAKRSVTAEDRELVRRALAPSRPKLWWRRSPSLWLAAAALLVAAVLVIRFESIGPRDNAPQFLGSTHLQVSEPNENAGDARSFQWTWVGTRPSTLKFVVRVFDVGSHGAPLVESSPCSDSPWTPTAGELSRIPADYEWEVAALLAGKPVDVSARQRAQHSR